MGLKQRKSINHPCRRKVKCEIIKNSQVRGQLLSWRKLAGKFWGKGELRRREDFGSRSESRVPGKKTGRTAQLGNRPIDKIDFLEQLEDGSSSWIENMPNLLDM